MTDDILRIDWDTAQVNVALDHETLTLEVNLSGKASSHWARAFRAQQPVDLPGIRWTVDGPSNGRLLKVRGLREERLKQQVESVRESLDSMVRKANEQAVGASSRQAATELRQGDQLERLQHVADEMTELFRAPPAG